MALPSKVGRVRKELPDGTELLQLRLRSVTESLARYIPAPADALIAVASTWPDFLKQARTMLIAAGFHPDCLIFQDARKVDWQHGMNQVAAIVCDSLTAGRIPKSWPKIVFPLLAKSSLEELRAYEDFITQPLS